MLQLLSQGVGGAGEALDLVEHVHLCCFQQRDRPRMVTHPLIYNMALLMQRSCRGMVGIHVISGHSDDRPKILTF